MKRAKPRSASPIAAYDELPEGRRYGQVPGVDHLYVGDDGTIWFPAVGDDTKVYIQWPPYSNPLGYQFVSRGRPHAVHRLVLQAFVGPCPKGMQCRHLDGNPSNNNLSNLCWGKPKENGEDRSRHRAERKARQLSGATP